MGPFRSVSVIIPNLNSPILDKVLQALFLQRLEPDVSVEVIVVGQDQPGHRRAFPGVHYVETPNPVWQSVARNMAILRATGQLILCLDADCVPDTSWIERMVAAHTRVPGRTVIGGGIRIDADNAFALADNLSSFHSYLAEGRPGKRDILPTCNVSMRREAFDEVGLFDESLSIGEDSDWMLRARRKGFSLEFCPDACVWHQSQRKTLRAALAHAGDWGYHSIAYRHRHSDVMPLSRVLTNWAVLLAFTPGIALATTAGIFLRNPGALRYWYVAPIVMAAKANWCLGAVRRLRQGPLTGT